MATVFVQIAVAVSPDGKWNACGFPEPGKLVADDAMNIAVDGLGPGGGEARYWVTVVLHVPEVETVEGKTASEGA